MEKILDVPARKLSKTYVKIDLPEITTGARNIGSTSVEVSTLSWRNDSRLPQSLGRQ